MEVLIVSLFVLFAIVSLEAAYRIALGLVRWTPVIAAGALSGWLAQRCGAGHLGALGCAAIAGLIARHLLRLSRRSMQQLSGG